MQFDAATGPEDKTNQVLQPCLATLHTPDNVGVISVVAAYGSSLARRVLVFRHRAWKGLFHLPLPPTCTPLAVSEAMYPCLQATFLTSPMPLNVLGVLVPVLGDVLCHPEPAVLSLKAYLRSPSELE